MLFFREKGLLAEAQGLKEGMEHILPWYPPVCVTLSDIDEGPKAYDHYEAVRQRTKVPLKLNDNIVREVGHLEFFRHFWNFCVTFYAILQLSHD